MEDMQRGKRPYSQFGRRLSEIRKSLSESVHEVSGAIEVDTEEFMKFENGEDRPTEDLLMLLVSYFDIKDNEADELFELAGYSLSNTLNPENIQMQPLVVIPVESRTVYTDSALMNADKSGLVISFGQKNPANQPSVVSRVGMSLEQAMQLVKDINDSIQKIDSKAEPKLLMKPNKVQKSKRTNK